MHRHDKDLLTVFISGGRTTAVFEGSAPQTDTFVAGVVRYRQAGFAHSTQNDGSSDFRAVLLEFDEPQGPSRAGGAGDLFCTDHFCVHRFNVAPGAALVGKGEAFFVPLGDTVAAVSGRRHSHPEGTIWRGSYGWINGAGSTARVIAVTTG